MTKIKRKIVIIVEIRWHLKSRVNSYTINSVTSEA